MHTLQQAGRLALAASLTLVAAGSALAADKTDGLWRGTAGAALAATSGNTKSTTLALNADMARATLSDKLALGATANYARSNGTTSANKWAAFGQYDYNLSPQWFGFGRLSFEGDGMADLDLRTAIAAGLGYKVINTPDTTFNLLGGVGYSTDKYGSVRTIAGKTDDTFSRSSLYLAEESTHVLSPTMSFKQRLDFYPGLSGDKAKIAKFTAGLSVAMSSTMNLTVGLVNDYNSKPAAGMKKNDTAFFTGVNMKLGAQ